MKVPRDVYGSDLVKGEHHVTIPNHKPLKTGTLVRGVLKPVAAHHNLTVEQLLDKLHL